MSDALLTPMLSHRILISVLLGAVVLPGVGLRDSCVPRGDPRSPDPIHDYLRSCERFGFSGSVLIAKGGKVVLAEGFGLADREKNVRNAKDTLFEIASATKSFTAVAILQLEQEGKLACDDPIGKHLPGVPAGFEDVTIHHLLTHTSGMPRSAVGGSGDDLQKAVTDYLSSKRTRRAGLVHEYWNGGYALLAGIVERVSGGTYMDWCRSRIFEPAGMKSSGFTGETLFDAAKLAIGYEGGDARLRRADEHPYNGSYGWHYRGMGGLVTTVEDLFRFDRALRDDTLLRAKARAKLFKPMLDSYACGFTVLEKPRRKIGHEGDVRGFHAQFFRYPDDDACIVVLCNRGGIPLWTVERNLQQLVFGDPSPYPKPPAVAEWNQNALDGLSGNYAVTPDERLVVRPDGDGGVLLGAEGSEIAKRIGPAVATPPRPADPELLDAAVTIVRRLSEGDVRPLRERMAAGIPSRWPDDVISQLWPERVANLGKLRTLRLAGASTHDASTTVMLALAFESGDVHIRIGFVGSRVQIFDLHGPEFIAEARALPSPDGHLRLFRWEDPQPPPIEILRDRAGLPTGLRFESRGASPIYKRLTSK